MRAYARELAFQVIFEKLFVSNKDIDEEFFVSLKKEEDKTFAMEIINNYLAHKDDIEQIIKSHLIGYEIDRVYRVDLALISEAICEIIYLKTPVKIIINEVINLAKKYSTEKSGKFINGVLSSIVKDLKLN